MFFLKFLLGVFFFTLTYKIIISQKILDKIIVIVLQILAFTLFVRSLFSTNVSVQQLATLLEIISIFSLIGIIFKGRTLFNRVKENGTNYIVYIIIIQLIHYIVDMFDDTDKKSLELANQSGLMISLIFLFLYNTKLDISKVIYRKDFFYTILSLSFIVSILVIITYFGFIKGNTFKSLDNSGGIGLQNLSTNETGLLGVCSIIYIINYLKKTNVSSLFLIFLVLLNIVVVLITKSRIGILSTTLVLIYSLYSTFKERPLTLISIGITSFFIVYPLIEKGIEIFESRAKNDTVDIEKLGYSNYANQLGFTLSGRVFIWEGYWQQFLKLDWFFWFFGSGFNNLIQMYKNSYLPILGDFSIGVNTHFFPMHSDLLLILISGGWISLLIWLLMITKIIKQTLKNYNFIALSSITVIVFYTMFDMLNYSLLASLLLGFGILQTKNYKI